MKLLRDVFGFEGRLGRAAYVGGNILLSLPAIFVLLQFLKALGERDGVLFTFALVAWHLIAWAAVAMAWKRLHDFGVRGHWALFALIPGPNALLFYILAYRPGEEGANRFGADPRAAAA